MELLDRYLQAVKFWLPFAQQKDIIEELRDELQSQMDDKEAELRRPLTENEVQDIIQRSGHPLLVASRYLPPGQLIGPVLFPIYAFILKMITFCYLLPWLLVWLVMVTFMPSYRAAHPGLALLGTLSTLWNLAFYAFALVTLVFAIFERVQKKTKWLENWDPRQLPPAAKRELRKQRQPRWESLTGLVSSILMLIAWLALPQFSRQLFAPASGILALAPGLRSYYLPILLLMSVEIALHGIMLWRPSWTWLPSAVRLVTTAVTLKLVMSATQFYPYIVWVTPATRSAHDLASVNQLNETILMLNITFSLGIAQIVALCVYAGQSALRLWRYLQPRFAGPGNPGALSRSQLF
jgi:hypothetical protein